MTNASSEKATTKQRLGEELESIFCSHNPQWLVRRTTQEDSHAQRISAPSRNKYLGQTRAGDFLLANRPIGIRLLPRVSYLE